MLKLNIISTALKKEIKTKSLYRSVNKLSAAIFIAVIVYSLSFFASKIIMEMYFNQLIKNNISLSRGPENYFATVKELNAKIENVEKIQKEAVFWSYLIEKIYALVNEGITISKIQASSEKLSFYLKGQALTRDSLLIFKENLEKSQLFENIELPIQNLLSKTNINFEMNLTLKNYEFK